VLSFGAGSIEVSGHTIARLNNVSVNLTYDTAPLRGGNLIFPTHMATYNGNCEGSFENGEVDLSAIGDMIGADQAASSITVSAASVLASGCVIKISCTTDGITGVLSIYGCRFPSLSFTIDRENYVMPTTNFIAIGSGASNNVIKWDTT